MNPKLLLALAVIVLALGCTGDIYMNETIALSCIDYLLSECSTDKGVFNGTINSIDDYMPLPNTSKSNDRHTINPIDAQCLIPESTLIEPINITELVETIDEELIYLICDIDLTRTFRNSSLSCLSESPETFRFCEKLNMDSKKAWRECMAELELDTCFRLRFSGELNETRIYYRCTKKAQEEQVINLTIALDDNIRSATLHYNAGGKEWKYITMYNATCHQITCECAKNTTTPCMAYCLECEDVDEGD